VFLGLRVFVNNVLPAFIIAAIGVLVDRTLQVDKKSLSKLAIYILTPCLVFTSVVQSDISASDLGALVLFVLINTTLMCALGLVVGHALRWPSRTTDALVMSIAFLNSGNLGLSIVLFALGETGFALATVFFMTTSLVTNTVAAFFAARSNGNLRQTMGRVLRLPSPYVFLLAVGLRLLWPDVQLPEMVFKPLATIGRAQIPIMLLLLGIQLSQTKIGGRLSQVSVAVVLRLVAGAAVAVALATLMGLEGLVRKVAIIEASTPTAVTSALMAIEFDADAEYVSSAILLSTLLSAVTLSAIIAWL